ncbi:HD domain-containing protein [Streptomyces sp. PSKA54]|uniref:HD domain-containing protein n=1 Tax=Streptomyces himalayensis subsp. aureolus TaxID=2758039 RepID=A0A7W2HE28_9ACTN|nr:HD domain-containing protein [Streptomyces himalayensis]MBA4860356.1 HD domain-containing protein [Streptomyces himalayensis subsp. aureolus]
MDDAYRELPFPGTDMALKTVHYVKGIEEPAIFNHSMRSYLYGRFLGEQQGLQPDGDYDDELLFLGCLLHDAGLSAEGNGDQRFDIDGADLAARFLTDQGMSAEKVDVVWDAVALHLHYEIAIRKRPEIALVTAGAGYDLGPEGPHTLPADYVHRIHAALPRLHAAAVLYDTIVGQALGKPHKAPPFSMPGELVRQRTRETWPTWEQLMTQPPSWNDYDGYQSKRCE